MAQEEIKKKPEESVKHEPQKNSAEETRARRTSLPPPDLQTFLSGIAGQVLISLGQVENPITKKRETDLDQAKYSIDLLQLLKDKMKGNLTEEEQRFLDGLLYDLRLRYVSACRR